jgi:transcriptional regulator with XRE-family HTH domain
MSKEDAKDKKEFLRRLGTHIAKCRKQKGYSQDRIYLEGGFSRGTLSKIENGDSSPEVYTLARIADVIGVPLKKLIDFE